MSLGDSSKEKAAARKQQRQLPLDNYNIERERHIMKKLLFKMLMPKPADIARIVANAAADFVNSTGKEEAISKFFDQTQKLQKA